MSDPTGSDPVPLLRPAPEERLPAPRPPKSGAGRSVRGAGQRPPVRPHAGARRGHRPAERQRPMGRVPGGPGHRPVRDPVLVLYELGIPTIADSSRLAAETQGAEPGSSGSSRATTWTEANCARRHGAQGQGGIGPVLNDQAKLYTHLNFVHQQRPDGRRTVRLRQRGQPDAHLGADERRAAQLQADRGPDRIDPRPEHDDLHGPGSRDRRADRLRRVYADLHRVAGSHDLSPPPGRRPARAGAPRPAVAPPPRWPLQDRS